MLNKSNYSKLLNTFTLSILLILTFFLWFTFTVLLIQGSKGAIIWYFMAVGLSLFLIFSK